jgi:hypothetical protein
VVFSFAVLTSGAIAAPVVKVFPPDGACVDGDSVTFEWEAKEGALGYWLLVRHGDLFSTGGSQVLYYNVAGEGLATSKTVTGFDSFGGGDPWVHYDTIHWWVFSDDFDFGTSSSFDNVPIEIPTRTSPEEGAAVCDAPSITFEWEAANCATNYWLLVKTDSIMSVNSPNTLYYDVAGEGDVTSKTVEGLPVDGTTLYWWVWSGDDEGNLCDVVQVASNGPGSLTSYGAIEVPDRTSPPDITWVYGSSVTLEWEAVEGANNYWLLVKTDSIYSAGGPHEIYYDVAGEGNVTSKNVEGLPADGATVYWWVWSGRTGTDCDNFCNLLDVQDNGPGTLVNVPEEGPSCTGSTVGSVSPSNPVYGLSDLSKHFAYLLLPIGAVILLSLRRRKR